MDVVGSVYDVNRRGHNRHLELRFPRSSEARLPKGSRAPITLVIGGRMWIGSICTTNSNPPYCHHGLDSQGERSTTTAVLSRAGLKDRDEVRFRIVSDGVFELIGSAGHAVPEVPVSPRLRPATERRPTPLETDSNSGFPIHDADAVRSWAEEYWTQISALDAESERLFEKELPQFRKLGYLTKEIFVRIARWKSVRSTPRYESNSVEDVEKATSRAFSAVSDAEAIVALTKLRGVGLRTATALLHWMMPDRYPILDFRVVAALGRAQTTNWESLDLYREVATEICRIATQLGVDLRTLDRALWTWQKRRSQDSNDA